MPDHSMQGHLQFPLPLDIHGHADGDEGVPVCEILPAESIRGHTNSGSPPIKIKPSHHISPCSEHSLPFVPRLRMSTEIRKVEKSKIIKSTVVAELIKPTSLMLGSGSRLTDLINNPELRQQRLIAKRRSRKRQATRPPEPECKRLLGGRRLEVLGVVSHW